MLVVGLGNPGPRYDGSPHNVGFRVVDHLAERHGVIAFGGERHGVTAFGGERGAANAASTAGAWSERFGARLRLAELDDREVVLLEPLSFMNRSGESVRKAMAFFQIEHEQALVVHDVLDLPLGALKLKRGGGEAGHNGLKSVSAELGTRDYARLRVGVGRPAAGELVDYLLAPLPAEASAQLDERLDAAEAAIGLWAKHGIEHAMNLVNRKAAGEGPARSEGQPD
jgi:PTH1 family peptidyl-tRNA hydrolase